jgi:hypothetical protein
MRQTPMPPVGFEPTIPASARPQTYALDRAATGIGFDYGTCGKDVVWIEDQNQRHIVSYYYYYYY